MAWWRKSCKLDFWQKFLFDWLGWNFRRLPSRSPCPYWICLNSKLSHDPGRWAPPRVFCSSIQDCSHTLIRVYLLSLFSWLSRHFGKTNNWFIGYLWALQHALLLFTSRQSCSEFKFYSSWRWQFPSPSPLRVRLLLHFPLTFTQWPHRQHFLNLFTRLSVCFLYLIWQAFEYISYYCSSFSGNNNKLLF